MSTFLDQPNTSTPVSRQQTTTPRPSLPRSNSTPSWHKNSSMENLRPPRTLQPPVVTTINTGPSLKKRHSTYTLPSPLDRPRGSGPLSIAPIRPLRNPARVGVTATSSVARKKSGPNSRPSTASSSREEITPWEFASGPVGDGPPPASPIPSGSASPLSAQARPSPTTGLVSEVTPWEMYPVRRSATSRSSLTSGFIEEVTPWELHPVPAIMPSRSTLATGPMEDVTPWELAAVPPPVDIPAPINTEKRSSARTSTSSSQGKSFSDLAHIRRRKSTSAKSSKPRPSLLRSPSHPSDPIIAGPLPPETPKLSIKPPKLTHAASAQPSLSSFPLFPPTSGQETPTPHANLNFSTADRAILEELKQNLRARDAQFVLKGEGSSLGSPLTSRGKKHHAFPPDKVPYPRSYEREVVDLDVWETASCQDICESLTWHVFDTPPTKVLDLGCGTGTWVLNCARAWKNCHFVGVDIVPLQPDLHQIGSSDLASRITWVHTNFLDGLPFPDNEFDFVHIKRIALGVPEDKWDSLFQDIIRVMKPGAAFEMLEEDLFFPGKSMDSDDELDLDSDSEKRSSFLSSHRTSTQSQMIYFEGAESEQPLLKAENSFSTATTTTFPATPSRSSSPAADIVVSNDFTKEAQELLAQAIGDYVLPLQEAAMPNNAILNDNLSPTTIRGHSQLKISPFTGSTLSLNPAAIGKGAPTNGEGHTELKSKNRSRAYSLSTSASVPDISSQRATSDNQKPASHVPPVPLLLRTIPKAPPNPRDHSLLEGIYTQLLGSRFINISPLALLANYVGFYFQDVRTHPPLQYHFPALSRKRPCSDTEEEEGDSESEDASSDDARDAILPSPISRSVRRQLSRRSSGQNRNDEDGQITEENRYVGVQGILHHSTPYITLDETRSSALSPSLKGLFPSISSAQIQRSSFLPNTTMHLDLKTLNLHLALRTAEIVACSESMWEWVRKFQADVKARRERDGILQGSRPSRSGSGSVEMPARISTVSLSTTRSSDPMEAAILDLTRDDFDALVGRFEMDMRDQCNLKNALGERFSWLAQEFSASQDRETFEKACEKWDRWQEEQLATTPQTRSHTNHSPRAPSGPYLTSYHLSSDSNAVLGEPNLRKRSSVSTTRSSVTSIPSRRLSRAMRVFVAWKSREIPLEDL